MPYKPGPPPAGLNNVGSYQVSGQPYISGSTTLGPGQEWYCDFPYVTRRVEVVNGSNVTLRVHFNSTGSSDPGHVVRDLHYAEVGHHTSSNNTQLFNVKCTRLYVSRADLLSSTGSFRVVADLTGIDEQRMYTLSGSGLQT
jgi:hypothetical protein